MPSITSPSPRNPKSAMTSPSTTATAQTTSSTTTLAAIAKTETTTPRKTRGPPTTVAKVITHVKNSFSSADKKTFRRTSPSSTYDSVTYKGVFNDVEDDSSGTALLTYGIPAASCLLFFLFLCFCYLAFCHNRKERYRLKQKQKKDVEEVVLCQKQNKSEGQTVENGCDGHHIQSHVSGCARPVNDLHEHTPHTSTTAASHRPLMRSVDYYNDDRVIHQWPPRNNSIMTKQSITSRTSSYRGSVFYADDEDSDDDYDGNLKRCSDDGSILNDNLITNQKPYHTLKRTNSFKRDPLAQ